jgi:hypothetical protein
MLDLSDLFQRLMESLPGWARNMLWEIVISVVRDDPSLAAPLIRRQKT